MGKKFQLLSPGSSSLRGLEGWRPHRGAASKNNANTLQEYLLQRAQYRNERLILIKVLTTESNDLKVRIMCEKVKDKPLIAMESSILEIMFLYRSESNPVFFLVNMLQLRLNITQIHQVHQIHLCWIPPLCACISFIKRQKVYSLTSQSQISVKMKMYYSHI